MVGISAENKAEVTVTNIHGNDNVNKTLFKLLCISDVKKKWGGKNFYDLTGKYEVKNMNNLTKQQIRKYKIGR